MDVATPGLLNGFASYLSGEITYLSLRSSLDGSVLRIFPDAGLRLTGRPLLYPDVVDCLPPEIPREFLIRAKLSLEIPPGYGFMPF